MIDMTAEQKSLIVESIILGEVCGLTDLVEYYNNQCRVLGNYKRYEDIPEAERSIIDAWFALYKEIQIPYLEDGEKKEVLIDDMFEWLYVRSQNRINEIQTVRMLVQRCIEDGSHSDIIKELNKHGY